MMRDCMNLKNRYGITAIAAQRAENKDDIDVFILAMKAKGAERGIKRIKSPQINKDRLVLSVLAGISSSYMEKLLHDEQQVIRVIPNTSSMIQQSATAISQDQYAAMDAVLTAKELLSAIGKVCVIDEPQMDIFTGIAGSGPAYFYFPYGAYRKKQLKKCLDPELAREIGAQTIYGAARMMMERDETPTELRENVTSPNGTTAAGLDTP